MASHFSADTKHHILLDYAAHDAARSFAALAARHAVAGGARTVQRWHCRWDRTPQSLERRSGSGKARTLTAAEVSRHIRAPILAANRAHRAISYTDLLSEVQRKTGKELSLRSLRRYGKEQLGARDKHSKKRTADESECNSTCEGERALLDMELWTDCRMQCRLACVTRSLPCGVNSSASAPHASFSWMRLHCGSTPLRITHSCCRASSHSSRRPTLLRTLLDTT